jgi:hypothetical protein
MNKFAAGLSGQLGARRTPNRGRTRDGLRDPCEPDCVGPKDMSPVAINSCRDEKAPYCRAAEPHKPLYR